MRSTIFLFFFSVFSFDTVAEFDHFISRQGHQLFDGKDVFRFAGIHAPELHRIEDDARGKCLDDPRGWGQYFLWPTEAEQQNWVKSLTRTGHKAMRIYTLSVEQEYDEVCGRETHILKPNMPNEMPRLNENAMRIYDRMIAIASEHKLRLILPFIDHWEWWGGRKQLAQFYNEKDADFYNVDSKTYAAYLHIIEQVITRKNTITGRYYFQEKAIMAWETGNELVDTNEAFLKTTAAFIKTLAPKQLTMDGTYLSINDYALDDPNIDIISNHFYTVNGNNKPETVKRDLQKIQGKKAYFVGEFGLEDIGVLTNIMKTVVDYEFNGAKAVGAFVWGFRGHRRTGGFYFHKEYTGHFSYRLPGFTEASDNQEIDVVNMVTEAQAKMNGLAEVPPLAIPEPPTLLPIKHMGDIRWIGSPLGRVYQVERKLCTRHAWQIVGQGISDGKVMFDPQVDTLFADNWPVRSSGEYCYRIKAVNESGISQPSNIERYTVK